MKSRSTLAAPERPTSGTVTVNGTTLYYERRGNGAPLLLVHGAGEDAGMLADQAAGFAAVGYDVVTYDRRGTGASGREDWPEAGAAQHADDAHALLGALDLGPTTVVGLSSGGVIGLSLAERHPETVARLIAWEPPAVGVVFGGAAMTAEVMAPIEAHLAEHPGDYIGAQAILLTYVLGFPVTTDDPAFEPARRNAESMIRDDPTITLQPFDAGSFVGRDITLAIGDQPNGIVAAASDSLQALGDLKLVQVAARHNVYFEDPRVLAGIVGEPR
ncbi:alpha/beta hydrolase [Agromyces intestinalis]|uniref:Alpha/beta hydrolase n=1 Tax=Agromyces intestinalis TaxID=2592652 RepID=A0A5C1YJD7_9MICO|nr:alpha/beta hydrolase [Agromyces intestinalis]QEO14922.1 alpha/beta hydrolase [Agromyces intestinalis]